MSVVAKSVADIQRQSLPSGFNRICDPKNLSISLMLAQQKTYNQRETVRNKNKLDITAANP